MNFLDAGIGIERMLTMPVLGENDANGKGKTG
jgi:hypothetical protein